MRQVAMRAGLGLGVVVWIALLWFWPRETNELSGDSPLEKSLGEGLYKSSLTEANFGLLGVDFYETSRGKKHWNIRSEFAELHRKENYAFMKVVTAKFYSANSGNVVRADSDYGRSWFERDEVHLEGNVLVKSQRGFEFTMDRLNYLGETREFLSKDTVHMKGPDVAKPEMYVQGVGMRASVDREHFRLLSQVRARKRMSTADWMRIVSRRGEFFTDEQRAVFDGSVKSRMPQVSLDSDHLEITFEDNYEVLNASGDVELRNRGRVGRAEQARIELGGDEIVLEGKARVEHKGNEIQGSRIVLYTNDDRIEVEKARGKAVP